MIGKIDQWDNIGYTELSASENQEIRQARRAGFSLFFPVTAQPSQGAKTLDSAREFMQSRLPVSDSRTLSDRIDDHG